MCPVLAACLKAQPQSTQTLKTHHLDPPSPEWEAGWAGFSVGFVLGESECSDGGRNIVRLLARGPFVPMCLFNHLSK